MYDIDHIINLLETWGLHTWQHPTKSDDGGWYAQHDNQIVQFNKFGVMMIEDNSVCFDGGKSSDSGMKLKDRWFAGIIYAECVV